MQIIYANPGKSKKEKITKARQDELERDWRDRNKRLKEIGLPKEPFEQFLEWIYGKGKKDKTKKKDGSEYKAPITKKAIREEIKMDSIVSKPGANSMNECALKPIQKYSGDKIIGISTMHKSNLVPVFSEQDAIDISKMRR